MWGLTYSRLRWIHLVCVWIIASLWTLNGCNLQRTLVSNFLADVWVEMAGVWILQFLDGCQMGSSFIAPLCVSMLFPGWSLYFKAVMQPMLWLSQDSAFDNNSLCPSMYVVSSHHSRIACRILLYITCKDALLVHPDWKIWSDGPLTWTIVSIYAMVFVHFTWNFADAHHRVGQFPRQCLNVVSWFCFVFENVQRAQFKLELNKVPLRILKIDDNYVEVSKLV